MTDTEFITWLSGNAAIPMVLIEVSVNVGGTERTRYLSTHAYIDASAGLAYEAIIKGAPRFPEKASLSDEASLSAGDITIMNHAGERDAWLADIWVNRPVKVWMGDPRWPRADFRLMFDGIVADIDSAERTTLNLKLRDKMQRLNTPVSEAKLGGTTTGKDALLPILLGEAHNITPLLTAPATLEYQFHAGPAEALIEVRDNGKPVDATPNLAAGKFTLAAQPTPSGALTVSAQGDKPAAYANTVAQLVQRLVTGYGKVSERFTAADIDTANFAAFDAANPQPVGLYLQDRENVLIACQRLASSVGAQLIPSRAGLLRLVKIALPAAGTPTVITAAQMVQGTLRPVERLDVKAGVKIGFCRNWTAQPTLTTSIPAEHKELFSTEWLTETVVDAATQATYRLHTEPEMRETCLLRRADASAEAARELALRKVPRMIYEFQGYPELFLLELGAPVTIFNQRFGMQNGVPGVVVFRDPDCLTGRITLGVMV
jgi:hypothetical protein